MKINLVILWRIYLSLAIIGGLLLIAFVLSSISAAVNTVVGGISNIRLVVLLVFTLIQLLFGILLLQTWVDRTRVAEILARLQDFTMPSRRQTVIYLLGILMLLFCVYIILLAPAIDEIFARSIIMRTIPFLGWATFLIIITLLGFGFLHGSFPFRISIRKSFLLVLIYISLSFFAWIIFAKPYIPELINRAGWNAPGVPIIEWQLVISWLCGMVLLGVIAMLGRLIKQRSIPARFNPLWIDLILGVVIWVLSVIIWQSVEITPSWFVSSKLPPNAELYPYSDARLYDTVAQDGLVGAGFRFFRSPYIRRPLHGLYLTILHAISGQNYEELIFNQILVLAFLPVLMYFLVKAFHNRISGGISAIIVILREANSIALAGSITTSHVKLLLVDVLTAMLVMVVIYIGFHWLKSVEDTRFSGLGLGGCLGLVMLLRLETLVFIPVILLLLFVILLPKRMVRQLVTQSLTFLIGIVLVVSPWILRNWLTTGGIYIDSPGHRQSLIFQRFTLWEESSITALPMVTQTVSPTPKVVFPEDPPSESSQLTPLPSVGVPQIEGLSLDPQSMRGLATYFFVHYLNSQVQSFLFLPSTFRGFESLVSLIGHHSLEKFWADCCSLKDYVRQLPFWHKWEGEFPRQSLLPIGITILLITSGISLMWKRHRWIGLLPVGTYMMYLIANAVFRNSGGRYILPVDWIIIMNFSIGLAYLSVFLYKSLFKKEISQLESELAFDFSDRPTDQPAWKPTIYYWIFVVCILVSISIPTIEKIIPRRFTPEEEKQMLVDVLESSMLPENQKQEINRNLQNGSLAVAGRLLYPQFFRANYGAPGYEEGPLSAKGYPRLVFFLTGENSSDLALPVQKKSGSIPNGSDALVILCPSSDPDYSDVLAVALFNPPGNLSQVIYRSSSFEDYKCPSVSPP